MSSARSATMRGFLSTAARWWRAILTVRLARLCISSICPIPGAALLKPPMWTAYASSSGRDSPRLQFSPPRQFTRAGDDRFSWPVLELTAQMPSLISLSASVSLSIRNLSVSRSEDGISEFMETIPHSVVFRMPCRSSLSRICRGKVCQSRKVEKGCLKQVSMLFMVGATRMPTRSRHLESDPRRRADPCLIQSRR